MTNQNDAPADQPENVPRESEDRRGFFSTTANAAMAGGLVASYGTFGVMAGQFVFPASERSLSWQFVAVTSDLSVGESLEYTTPSGAKIVIARQSDGDSPDDFIALSSVCPHLGCQVFWEPHRTRFFCPCHNGVFDPSGKATEGPPASVGQQLKRYPLRVEGELLYVEAPTRSVGGTNSPREV